jgi:hypothetical protein
MNLSLEPDIYEPNINEKGDYIDNIPYSSKFQNVLRCPCGTRKEHVFDIRSSFGSHIKTKTHQKWLQELNTNKLNHYTENIKLKELIGNQKLIIAKLQKDVHESNQLVAHLTKKIAIKENANLDIDLLNF